MNLRSSQPPDEPRRLLSPPLVLLIALLVGAVALPGCGGCWGGSSTATAKKKEDEEKDQEKKKKKKLEKPKDDFEPLAIRMLPSNDPTPADKTAGLRVKPGHWIAVSETAKANNFDFPGELATFAQHLATSLPVEIEDKTSRLSVWCPAILPKGQTKRIETVLYIPRRDPKLNLGSVYSLRSELRGARGGRTEMFTSTNGYSLKDYEHLIVVLAGDSVTPAAYSHFDKLHSVRIPWVEAVESEPLQHYQVVRPESNRSVPLPSYSLAWTTIAYVFWDDLDPAVLTNLQQQALLDWLHWGGQLVVSGPSSLDKLKGSFLAPYLPAEISQTIKLDQDAFEELNRTFSLPRDPARAAASPTPPKNEHLRKITILPERPMLGVELKKHADAREIEGTGGLVVERRVGGGRIVVTRFPLTDVRIKQWRNFDGFFNAVLLRRPAREFSQDNSAIRLSVAWAEPLLRAMLLEARLGSTLRYFSRDIGFMPSPEETTPGTPVATASDLDNLRSPVPPGPRGRYSGATVYGAPGMGMRMTQFGYEDLTPLRPNTFAFHPDIDDWHFCGYQSSVQSGVAGWNDGTRIDGTENSGGAASEAARQSLAKAAGIEIPRAEFVMQVLGVYLLVLVPLNWLVFWLIGRVEWAWVAAPLIAILGAGAVIRLAQLDIGFARSRTEIAILEIQDGYERAHLTRYTALYTSLSSNYTAAFDDPCSLALPFAAPKPNDSLLPSYADVSFRRDKETSLAGVQVSSNSTGMVHSEQMLPLGTNPKITESLVLVGDEQKGYSIRNTTDLALRDVGVFLRAADVPGVGDQPSRIRIETAYVAKIEPGPSVPLRFSPLAVESTAGGDRYRVSGAGDRPVPGLKSAMPYPTVWLPEWDKTAAFAPLDAAADRRQVRLTTLAQLAAQQLRLLPGDVRLVAWTDQRLPGMQIRPEAPQNKTYTLVLAHLIRGSLPPVKPDRNVAEDYLGPSYFDQEPDGTEPAIEVPNTPATRGM